jgi:hypothetical protein
MNIEAYLKRIHYSGSLERYTVLIFERHGSVKMSRQTQRGKFIGPRVGFMLSFVSSLVTGKEADHGENKKLEF